MFGASQGAYATRIVANANSVLPSPKGWSHSEAAGLFVTAPTAYAALVTRAAIKPGDFVLVHAAGGGVGLAAVQGNTVAPSPTPRPRFHTPKLGKSKVPRPALSKSLR